MIAHALQTKRVSYRLFDINSRSYSEWARGRTFDLIAIGMGVHWLRDDVLFRLRDQLRPQGQIAILATGMAGPDLNPWYRDYMEVRYSLRNKGFRDWTGEERLKAAGYANIGLIEQGYRSKVDVRYLVDNMLSFSAEAEKVSNRYRQVLTAMEKRLAPHMCDGTLDCTWISSARLFVDQKSTAIPLRTQSP
jgi:hypothetical protein